MPSSKKPSNDEDSQKVQEISTGRTEKDKKNWLSSLQGLLYQVQLLLWYLVRGASKHYNSFRLSTQLEQAQKFDAVIFEYVENGKKNYRLVQVKRRRNQNKKLKLKDDLLQTYGDFSLLKYFNSYKELKNEKMFQDGEIKDLVLFTNIDFDLETKVEVSGSEEPLAISDIVTKLEYEDDILDFTNININLERRPARYKFNDKMTLDLFPKILQRNKNNNPKFIKEFFDRLVFAVNQPNKAELSSIIKGYIKQNFNILPENAYDTFFVRMQYWFSGEGNEFLINQDFDKWVEPLKEHSYKTKKLVNPILEFRKKIENEKLFSQSEIVENLILKNFLLPEKKPTYQILHFESNETKLTSIKVYQFLPNTKFQYNYYYFKLKDILENKDDLILDLQKKNSLLIIECMTEENLTEINELVDILKVLTKNAENKIVLVTKPVDKFAKIFKDKLGIKYKREVDANHNFSDLEQACQTQIDVGANFLN